MQSRFLLPKLGCGECGPGEGHKVAKAVDKLCGGKACKGTNMFLEQCPGTLDFGQRPVI